MLLVHTDTRTCRTSVFNVAQVQDGRQHAVEVLYLLVGVHENFHRRANVGELDGVVPAFADHVAALRAASQSSNTATSHGTNVRYGTNVRDVTK